jgi:hypothetical protein
MSWLFMVLGVAAGLSQALLLGAAARGRVHTAGFLLRFLLVGGFLFSSAFFGHLLAGAGGWFCGFAVTAAWVAGRLR